MTPPPLLEGRCPCCGAELTVAQPPERGRCWACRRWACRRWLTWNPVLDGFNEDYMSEHPATRAYRAFALAFAACLPALLACFLPRVRRLPTLPQRPAAPQTQPRTLHQALAANPRPVRPYCDARPTRTPPAQRRR